VGPVPLPRRALGLGHVHARYSFRPWREAKAIADGPSILRYIRAAAHQHGVDRRVRYHRRVVRAAWSSSDARWTVEVENAESGELERLTCRFLYGNTGYYRYDEGYSPRFEGASDFGGASSTPALAGRPRVGGPLGGGHRQRRHRRHARPGAGRARIARHDAAALTELRHVIARARWHRRPAAAPAARAARLPVGAVEERGAHHLRLPAVPACTQADGAALEEGCGEPAPGRLRRGNPLQPPLQPMGPAALLRSRRRPLQGIEQRAGVGRDRADRAADRRRRAPRLGRDPRRGHHRQRDRAQHADARGMAITVDGRPLDLAESVAYKGIMLCGVPNLAFTIGYTNASWTLKATSPPATSAGSSTTWTSAVPARAGPSHPIRRSRGSR